jgi:hypothetical protein
MTGARILCLLLVAALCATTIEAAENWTYGSSEHFEVYTTGDAAKARDALNYFERIHAFFSEELKIAPKTQTPMRLIVFSSDREFAPYRPNERAAAYYQPGPDRDYIVIGSLDAESYPIVVHEYWHLVVRHLGVAELPPWMSEGWAEYYSTIEPRGDSIAVGRASLGRLQELSRSGTLMPLDRLLAVRRESPEYNDERQMSQLYAQSWALVHMLLAGKDYVQQAPTFLRLMLAGTDSATAIVSAYGRPLERVAADLEDYVRSDRFQFRVFDYQFPKAAKDLKTRPATSFEARLATANLRAATISGEDDARAAFAQLEREDEAHLELQESIATFEYGRGHWEAAEPHYARAVALGSSNWRIFRDYADGVSDATRRLELLETSLKLNPNDLDVRLRFADGLVRADRHQQASSVLASVKEVDRSRAFFFFQLSAVAHASSGRMESARSAAARAVTFAESSEEKSFASSLVARLTASRSAPPTTERSQESRGGAHWQQ